VIVREDSQSVAVIRMAHGKVSAIDLELCAALTAEFEHVAASAATALVLTGTGSTFSAGVDLFRVLEGRSEYLERFLPAMGTLFRTLLTFPRPAIAAVNGHAMAGGCILAAACDHRVMADGTARIGIPELAVGVPFPPLPFEIVRARVNPSAFHRLVYAGGVVQPREAVDVGLIDELAEPAQLIDRAREVAARLARIPPQTFELTKRTFTAPLLARVDAAASIHAEVLEAWRSDAVLNRMRAYLDETVSKRR
jgi:enoyl-CoA hydratase